MQDKIDGLKMVPLSKAVSAALIDSYTDINKAGVQQMYFHWGARGFKKINTESFGLGKNKALIKINKSTQTAILPVDFESEIFVGVIDRVGRKIKLRPRQDLADLSNIDTKECIETCAKCGQDRSMCKDLEIIEDTKIVVIDDSPYEQTIIKKLYKSGDYYIETRIPVKVIGSDAVEYITQKEFVTKLSLKPCGCIDDTPENMDVIKYVCPEAYSCYFSPCVNVEQTGNYQIFEETGLIRVNVSDEYSYVYIEYKGCLPKINGQYYIPEMSFETIVRWIIFKSIEWKRNVNINEKTRAFEMYRLERSNMEKVLFSNSISLQQIIQSSMSLPKFDFYIPMDYNDCQSPYDKNSVQSMSSPQRESTSFAGTITQPPSSGATYIPLSIAVISGSGSGTPVPGVNFYQNDKLIGAVGVETIIVNNNIEHRIKGEFRIDTITGTITRFQPDGVTPNDWQASDVLVIVPIFKMS